MIGQSCRERRGIADYNELGTGEKCFALEGMLVVAQDIVGGIFAINRERFAEEISKIWYFAPDTLDWECMDMSYPEFVSWLAQGDIDSFYRSMRWEKWREDCEKVPFDDGIYIYPLNIDGMGLVLYSEGAVQDLVEGENFFQRDYATPQQVAAHIKKGDIVGFCTGSGGRYHVKFRDGYPDESLIEQYPVAIRLALDVKGGKISIIDLFWLTEWSRDCPREQQLCVEDGIYHLTVATAKPASGIWGMTR